MRKCNFKTRSEGIYQFQRSSTRHFGTQRLRSAGNTEILIAIGCGAKNLALLQNQYKPSQLGKLINLITRKWYTKIIVSNCGNIIFELRTNKDGYVFGN
jgi:hypothetical protein